MVHQISESGKMSQCDVCCEIHYSHCKSYRVAGRAFLIACVALCIRLLVALPVRADAATPTPTPTPVAIPTLPPTPTPSPTLEYLGIEILNENGAPVPNSIYYLHCLEDDLIVEIEVTFSDGAVDLLTGQFCNSKIYIVGIVTLARIVSASAAPTVMYRVWLPVLAR